MVEERKIINASELVDYIVEVMKQSEIKPSSIEEHLNFSKGLISRWCKKKIPPEFSRILEVINYLNINMVFKKRSNINSSKLSIPSLDYNEVTKQLSAYITQELEENKKYNHQKFKLESDLKISAGILSRWSNGKHNPRMDILFRIMSQLNVNVILFMNTLDATHSNIIFERDFIPCENTNLEQSLKSHDVILNSELLKQQIQKKLSNKLNSDIAKSACNELFSNQISYSDMKTIQEYLNHFIKLQEQLIFFEQE